MNLLTSRRWAVEETWRGLCRDKGLSLFAVLLCALALSIPLFIAIVFYGLSEPLRSLPTAVELTVFTTEKAQVKLVEADIRSMPWVARTRIVPSDEALKELTAKLGIPETKGTANPLPDIIIATLSESAGTPQIASTARRIESLKGVDFVPYEASWHEKLQAVTQAAGVGLGLIGSVVLVLVLLVLEVSIRMPMLTARSEMSTLYILGASPSFTIRPYAWRGMVLMGTGAVFALGLAQGGILLFGRSVQAAAALYDATISITLPPPSWCAAFVAAAAFCGGIVAGAAALRAWRGIRRIAAH